MPIHEINETEDGQLYLVMAYYEGETLKQRIDRGSLPVGDAVNIATQVGQGLSKAHAAGIIHRDLKSADSKLRPDGTGKVLDFGSFSTTRNRCPSGGRRRGDDTRSGWPSSWRTPPGSLLDPIAGPRLEQFVPPSRAASCIVLSASDTLGNGRRGLRSVACPRPTRLCDLRMTRADTTTETTPGRARSAPRPRLVWTAPRTGRGCRPARFRDLRAS